MKIGVFDSGRGGAAVAARLSELLPDAEIICVDDHDHVPYGGRLAEEIIELADHALQPLFSVACDAIVIACNTATTVAIKTLRERYPQQVFIGIEPMVKPAASQSTSRRFAVFATPATLQSPRYNELKQTWAADCQIIEPDCSGWATAIEHNQTDSITVELTVRQVLADGADVIVLACTHYHWLKGRIEAKAGPSVLVLEPSDAIKNRIQSLLGQRLN